MRNALSNKLIEPYFYSCDSIITDVNKEFIDFTGFSMGELLGKSITEICSMLKINSKILLDNIKSEYPIYIFTKSLYAREVNLSLFHDVVANGQRYTFVEKPNSRLDDKLIFMEQMFIDNNITGYAVYSAPDLILLKSNQKYLGLIASPLNNEGSSIGRPIKEIVEGFVGSECDVVWNSILETKKNSYIKEFRSYNFKDDVAYWNFTQTAILENGKIKYIFETASEVTAKVFKNQSLLQKNKIIEQTRKIEEQKKQLEAIIENISDGISIFDSEGKYISFNKSERKMFFPYYEYLPQTNDRYYIYIDKTSDSYNQAKLYNIKGQEITLENTPICRVMRGEKFKNMRMTVKFPHKVLQINISGTPIYDSEGKFTLGVLCSQDMTDYFKREEAIRDQYKFLNRLVDTFDLPVVRISCPNLNIVDINKKAFNIIKLLKPDIVSVSNLIQNKLEDLFKIYEPLETSKCYQYINEVIIEKKTKYFNKKAILLNGNQLYWNIIFEPIIDVNGEIQEILVIVIDVTAEIKSNIVMEKALKLQGEFLVNISHELKTPLNVIFATAQLFDLYCNSGSLDDKKNSIIKYIESIKQNSYRLSKLINNIVDLSKIEAGFYKLNLSNNNIVPIVEDIVMSITNIADIRGLNIIFDTDTEENIIACDPEAINRIVLNLISNAIKFSDMGDEIFVTIVNKNEFVEISVKDNGIGIEDKNLDMIFDRFKQVDKSLSKNSEGTGIGLSLVKSIVELHGGSIHVESDFGKGSKFTVKLPSRRVLQESKLYISKLPIKNQNIRVELSDIY
ncbi:PAS domain-containing protein [Clostridium bowmanii]|uniref:PAS domain-containing sensor histidine kinase n=1 Tax=Clostridium bowmanii TaxID=132925 RepID=UPI001C0BC88A|nr:ATP-binding protein [Clostridium bowmanii]MBU3189495.1 PAS domain-containing protein [Clostridium bowmanii]MCA1074108.1 PAS domain-containing protein [Clostridium bowmanii]